MTSYPDRRDTLLNILDECKKAGDPDRVMIFASTSKISYAGAGIAVFACSEAVMKRMKELLSFQTIGFDKLNMLRHARYFGDLDGVMRHMDKHAELLRPKFGGGARRFDREHRGQGDRRMARPQRRLFHLARRDGRLRRRVVRLCKEAGVVLTGAGATYPYKKDRATATSVSRRPTRPSPSSNRRSSCSASVCSSRRWKSCWPRKRGKIYRKCGRAIVSIARPVLY